MKDLFHKIATKVSAVMGNPGAFLFALLVVIIWATTGPLFNFSDTWQLVINTSTTIITFLMVFLIQNTQNRDSKAMQLKLDELIRSSKYARDAFVGLETLSDDELSVLDKEFSKLHEAQAKSPFIQKLHQNIKVEHARRKGHNFAYQAADQVVDSLLHHHKS
ncbi:low affinity iron permease family protein [bacterium]|nr:low affinity iron permease family protein [bacterium]NDC94604.1 low affinity iron permease family protein [bacterium]NDD84489.1 low affinity iron permease family protein [bacterium]NDG30103.1 low affinity iron permease family protein [bacterium]